MFLKKGKLKLILGFFIFLVLFFPSFSYSSEIDSRYDRIISDSGEEVSPLVSVITPTTGLTSKSIPAIVGSIIQMILGLFAIIGVCVIVYAGIIWMTSAGDATKIQKAKKLMINTLIGMLIIFSSYALTSFFIGKMTGIFGSGSGSSYDGGEDDPYDPGNLNGSSSFRVESMIPFDSSLNVKTCARVASLFNADVLDSSIYHNDDSDYSFIVKNSVTGDDFVNLDLESDFTQIKERSFSYYHNDNNFATNTTYLVNLTEDIKDTSGRSLTPKTWSFTTEVEESELEYPVIYRSFPLNNSRDVCRNSNMQFQFSYDLEGDDLAQMDYITYNTDNIWLLECETSSEDGENCLSWSDEKVPITVTAKSDSTGFTITANSAMSSYTWYRVIIKTAGYDGISQNNGVPASQGTVNNPNVDASDGISDICGRPLDGNKNGLADGTYFSSYDPDTDLIDDYVLEFKTNSDINCLPFISSVTPDSGLHSQDLITIEGENFGIFGEIFFNGFLADDHCYSSSDGSCEALPLDYDIHSDFILNQIGHCGDCEVSWNNNLIEYKVSENAVSGVLKVEVGNYSAESDFDVSYKMNDKEGGEIFSDIKNIFIPEVLADEYDVSYGKDVEILSPNIASLSANSGPIGQFVTIRGKNFGNEISKVWFVKISDYSVVEAYAPLSCDSLDTWSDNEIIIEVPTLELTNYRIIVGIDSEMGGYYYSNGEPFEVLEGEPGPGLCSIDPNSQFVGFPVVLDGVNFGSGKESDSIYFGKDVVDEYISTYSDVNYWSSDSIELIVPSDAYSNNVYVKVDDKFSNSLRLSVLEDFSCPDEVKDICDNVGINGIGLFSREECESQHDACLFTDGAFNTCVADPSVCINFPECSDYIDNDGDGLIDYPNDPECIMAETDSEINSGETPDDPPHPEGECGDGVYTPGVEVCDSSSSFTITETCSDYGYGTGALGCTDDCNYDYSGCSDPPTGSLICEFGTEETRINPFPVEITSGNAYGIVAADGSYTYGKSWHGYHDKDNRIAKFGLDGTEIGDLSSFDTSLAMTYYPVFTDNNGTHDKGVIFNGYSTYNAYLGGTNRLQVMDLETGGVYLSDPLENLHRRNDVSSVLDTNYSQILVTSDGKYLYTLSYTRSTGYNGYTVNKYDPRDSMKLIDEYIFYGTSLYTDGVIADGNYLYAFQWSGNGTITRLNLENETIAYSWRSEQRNSSDLHTGRVDIINGQFDWKNNVIWMGDLVDHDRNDLDENAWIYKYTSCSTASYSCGDGICMPSESCPLDCGTLVDTIQIRAKAKKYDSINPILEFWYRKTTGEWEKLFEDEITNQTFFLNYKYNLETSINMTGFAIAYQNDGDPKTDRELYVDSIRFNGDSEKIEFNGTDENIIYDLGSSSNAWRDDLNTEVPAGVLDENGAFRTKITYPPQCENGIQDEDELGVDCGGPCASCPEDEDPDDPVVSGTCGNGVIDGDEWCDYSASTASNLKCSDFGYDSSDKVRCDTSCVVDLSFCPGYNPSPNETCEFLTKDTREQEVGEFKPKFSGGGETSDAVGLTATAGDYMYVKSYSAYDGDDQNLTKVRKSDGVVVENIGTLSSSISMFYHPPYTDYLGFHEDGVIYNGYVDSGRIRILDLKINQKYWSKTPNSFLMRPDDSNVTASGGNVLLTFDGKYIYNLSYKISSLYDGFKVKVYDPKNNMRLVNSWSTSYPSFEVGGIVADAGYLYAIEKGDNARVVRMNAETGAYIYQWKTENDFGYAEFDGVDDYMVIPNTSDFNFGEGGITYSSWIKTTSSQTDYIAYHNHYSDVYYYITGGRVR
ncbi:IPT/TIG domain-containing protein, partial [Patescibacteria group bacterium]|nr:IPT/TIG domain-containing protein [Patescibacteria group bacterium]